MNRKYTAPHLAFIRRRRRQPRRELLAAFRRKYPRAGMTLLKLQDLCSRHGWRVGSTKGRKYSSRRYSKAELAFISRRRKLPRRELHAAFVAKFRRTDVSFEHIKQFCTRNGWSVGSRKGRRSGILLRYSKAEISFVRRRQKMARRALHAEFVARFKRADVSFDCFKQLCQRQGLRTGRTGCFPKGMVPANKGKKMPYNAGSARTQFKKGHLSGRALERQNPIGSERVSGGGYLERKIHNGLPKQSRWRGVHRINWEAKHGPVPRRHVLKCLDGNPLNTDPSNWELISRAVLARRNKRFAGAKLPPELEHTAIAIAKLDNRLGERRRIA